MNVPMGWLPFAALLRRELVVLLRKRSTGINLAAFVLMSIGGVWMLGQMPFPREMSAMVFRMGIVWSYVVSLLLVPAVAAAAMANERQNNTLDMLLITLVRARSVVSAKALTAFGMFLLLCIGVLPVFGIIFFYVGVDVAQFLQAAAILFAATIAHAMLGAAAGVNQRNVLRAMVGGMGSAVVFSAGLWAGIATALIMAATMSDFLPDFMEEVLPVLIPMAHIAKLQVSSISNILVLLTVIWQLLIALLAWMAAVFLLRRAPRQNTSADPARQKPKRSGRGRSRLIRDGINPMFIKELRGGVLTLTRIRWLPFLKSTHIVFMGALFFVLVYRYIEAFDGGPPSFDMVAVIWIWGSMLAFIAPTIASASLVRERKTATYDLLSTTLLTPRHIVVGHVMAGIVGLWVLLWAGVLGALAASLFGVFPTEGVINIVIAIAAAMLQYPILVAIGSLSGAVYSNVVRAIVLSMLCALLYLMLPTLLVQIPMVVYSLIIGRPPAVAYHSEWLPFFSQFLSPPLSDLMRVPSMGSWLFHGIVWIPITLLAASLMTRVPRMAGRLAKILGPLAPKGEY